jgi:hypothetical protein
MVKSHDYKQLMESLNRIFDVLPDMEDDEKESEGKTRSITIVTMGKGKGLKIPKAGKKQVKNEELEEDAE